MIRTLILSLTVLATMAPKCVHQGCGKEIKDPEEACHYHPGPPIFHEGQKGSHFALASLAS